MARHLYRKRLHMKKIFYILIICCGACTNTINQDINKAELPSITLIDTFTNELKPDTANHITEAAFHPMYMGLEKDSIQLNYWSGDIDYKTQNWNAYKGADSNDVSVFVDTSQVIGSVGRFHDIPPPALGENTDEILERNYYRGETKSYPVFIKNLSSDTLQVGYGAFIPLLMEARDSLGNWKKIQEPFMYFCGTGLSHYYLPPNEIILTPCKLFAGDFKTTMRLTYGFGVNSKSSEFEGFINYSQFERFREIYD